MSVIFSTVQSILNNILQDLEIQNLTNHLKFETLPYFSQIRAITKPEFSTFDSDQEVQKVETSQIDNIIVSTYGMVDNSLTNEVFKRKNGFKSRINSYVNPLPKIKEEMNYTDSNPSVFFMDDLMDMYGLSDESILFELTNLYHEEELNRIQREVLNSHSTVTSSEVTEDKSYINSNSSLGSQNNASNSSNNISNNNSQSSANIDNNSQSQSYVIDNNHTKSNVRIDESYNNIIPSNNNLSNSSEGISKSGSYNNQSQVSNSNEEMNRSASYNNQMNQSASYNSKMNKSASYNDQMNKSTSYNNQSQVTNERDYSGTNNRSQSYSESSPSQSQESVHVVNENNSHSRSQSLISASNSMINSINCSYMNPISDPIESIESLHEDALIFPEVADGQTLEIIK